MTLLYIMTFSGLSATFPIKQTHGPLEGAGSAVRVPRTAGFLGAHFAGPVSDRWRRPRYPVVRHACSSRR
jgi:hypothetical protein